MIQLILRKLSSPVVLISSFALMLALSLPLQQHLRSIPSIAAEYGSLENLYNQPELHLASSQVDLYLDIPRASRITPYLVVATIDTKGISTHYIENSTDPKKDKELVLVVPPPIVTTMPTDNAYEFTIRSTDASVAYRKGLYDFGLIYAKRMALRGGLLDQARRQLDLYASESQRIRGQVVHIDTSSWNATPLQSIAIPSTRLSIQPYHRDRVDYNTSYSPDRLSYRFITMEDKLTGSTLNMSIYNINTQNRNNSTAPQHNLLRTYSGNIDIKLTLNATGLTAIVADNANEYSFVVQSPSPNDFTSFLPIALDTLLSLEVNNSATLQNKPCSDLFYNNLDAWLNADAQTISAYIKGGLNTEYFNPNKIFQTLDIHNTTVIYDKNTLEQYQGNLKQLTTRLQNIGSSSELTSQTANFALYSKNALVNGEDLYILFLKTRAYIYVYDDSGNSILDKILNYYQLQNNYKVVINNQSLCSDGRLYEYGDAMFCFSKTYLADFLDKMIANSFVALFKCGL